jgi:hypothetical protein
VTFVTGGKFLALNFWLSIDIEIIIEDIYLLPIESRESTVPIESKVEVKKQAKIDISEDEIMPEVDDTHMRL